MLDKGGEYRMLRPWLNEGLLLSGGKKWFQRRKIITPAFHFKILEEFVKVFDRQGNIFVDILSKRKPNEQIELLPLVTLYTLDVICGKFQNCHYKIVDKFMSDNLCRISNGYKDQCSVEFWFVLCESN